MYLCRFGELSIIVSVTTAQFGWYFAHYRQDRHVVKILVGSHLPSREAVINASFIRSLLSGFSMHYISVSISPRVSFSILVLCVNDVAEVP